MMYKRWFSASFGDWWFFQRLHRCYFHAVMMLFQLPQLNCGKGLTIGYIWYFNCWTLDFWTINHFFNDSRGTFFFVKHGPLPAKNAGSLLQPISSKLGWIVCPTLFSKGVQMWVYFWSLWTWRVSWNITKSENAKRYISASIDVLAFTRKQVTWNVRW